MPVVYTGATFDLFHKGHILFLQRCASLGEVTVALNTDEFVRRFKNKTPIHDLEDRMAVVGACRWVHSVVVNEGGENSVPTIEKVKPNFIVIGSDWEKRDYHRQMGFTPQWLFEQAINLVYLPYSEGISSTILRERLRDSCLDANSE